MLRDDDFSFIHSDEKDGYFLSIEGGYDCAFISVEDFRLAMEKLFTLARMNGKRPHLLRAIQRADKVTKNVRKDTKNVD